MAMVIDHMYGYYFRAVSNQNRVMMASYGMYYFFNGQKSVKNASMCTSLVVNPTTMDHFHSHSMLLAVLHRKQKPSRDEVTEHKHPNSKIPLRLRF